MNTPLVRITLLAAALFSAASATALGQDPPAVAWKTGKALETQLRLPAGITWGETPLRQGLENLSRSNGVAIWLDRRVDPDQKVEFQIADTPLEQVLQRLAQHLKLESVLVGPVVYIGPPSIQNLSTLAAVKRQESEALPDEVRRKMADLPPAQWEDLAEPRALLEQTARRCGLRPLYMERIPHDLWPARQLPAMHGAELLTIMLAGFGKSFEFAPDASAIRPIEMPERITLVRGYTYDGDVRAAAAKIREFFPHAKLAIEEGKLVVEGSQEEHREIGRFLSGQTMRRTTTLPGTKLYSLEVQGQPVAAIVQALGKQLGREVRFDPAVTEEHLNKIVSFAVKEKSLPELLQAVLKPAGLDYELTSESITVRKLAE